MIENERGESKGEEKTKVEKGGGGRQTEGNSI